MKTCIYWHRNDLRLHDNECLSLAVDQFDLVIPLYIVDPDHYRLLPYGFKKTGPIRYSYLVEAIKDLKNSYQSKGGNLMIQTGSPTQVLAHLSDLYKVNTVFAQKEIAREEVDTEKKVTDILSLKGVNLNLRWGKTLYHKDDVPYSQETIPLTSKTFRLNVAKATSPRPLIPTPIKIVSPSIKDWGTLPSPQILGFSEDEGNRDCNFNSPAGETYGLKRLNYYSFESQLLTSYKWTRNKSLGMDYSSKLSPYLANGSLSPRMIYHEVKRYEKEVKRNISTWWLIFEIMWRDFFTFKSWRIGDSMFYKGGIRNKKVSWNSDHILFEKWKSGSTGIPFIDAHQKELKTTGFMSNRGRVNSASFFTQDYQLDWRWGAAWFEYCLIDYDVHSNWMNWHTQAFDMYYTNPVHQSNWLPELAALPDKDFHAPWLYSHKELINYGITQYEPPVSIYKKWNRSINNIIKERR